MEARTIVAIAATAIACCGFPVVRDLASFLKANHEFNSAANSIRNLKDKETATIRIDGKSYTVTKVPELTLAP